MLLLRVTRKVFLKNKFKRIEIKGEAQQRASNKMQLRKHTVKEAYRELCIMHCNAKNCAHVPVYTHTETHTHSFIRIYESRV